MVTTKESSPLGVVKFKSFWPEWRWIWYLWDKSITSHPQSMDGRLLSTESYLHAVCVATGSAFCAESELSHYTYQQKTHLPVGRRWSSVLSHHKVFDAKCNAARRTHITFEIFIFQNPKYLPLEKKNIWFHQFSLNYFFGFHLFGFSF